ncbi:MULTISPECIES: STY4534 family ICE replication protein [unclassified Pseudomonas]|uniref:STY4534 family ICE replication protein n=1 Tax=unclassified Pseudomonas TaxID=196821 RepID=UPI00236283A2|nr:MULTISPECIES: STY4534 family ICE replication protein [unclassified Pseudomonas]
MSNQANESQYFDLHTTGIGYLNRIREVKPKGRGAKPFLAVTVAALCGSKEAVEYRYIDCNVVGTEAEKLVRRCIEAVNAEKKVLVSFRIGDCWADPFTYSSGPKQGQHGASLKGRLLYIGWIKVEGEFVYEAKPRDAAPAEQQGTDQGDDSDQSAA